MESFKIVVARSFFGLDNMNVMNYKYKYFLHSIKASNSISK